MREMKNYAKILCVFGLLGSNFAHAETSSEQQNIDLVTSFYSEVFVEHKTNDAALKYLEPSYIQHNPNVPTGRKAFIDFFIPFFEKNPSARSEIKRIIASNDLVMVHVHSKMNPLDRGRAIIDIFRVKDDRIVEHWDVIQAIPENSANDNGIF